jgi:hypothetical protein
MKSQIMKHHQKPEIAKLPKNFQEMSEKILKSDYYAYVARLTKIVKGRTVKDSFPGRSGFILFLDNGDWIASFLHDDKMMYEMGSGKPGGNIYKKLNSKTYGDASEPLSVDLPYSDEECDIASELKNSHGKPITGLSIGEDSFNFCFPKGMELEAMLVPDETDRTALRVFWEQW